MGLGETAAEKEFLRLLKLAPGTHTTHTGRTVLMELAAKNHDWPDAAVAVIKNGCAVNARNTEDGNVVPLRKGIFI